jgi:hypothetical protein
MRIVMAIASLALLAGCGPSAQVRRACEMYVEAGGGGEELGADFWLKRGKENGDSIMKENPNADATSVYALTASVAEEMSHKAERENKAAKAFVSLRLTMSLSEVERALAECPAHKA